MGLRVVVLGLALGVASAMAWMASVRGAERALEVRLSALGEGSRARVLRLSPVGAPPAATTNRWADDPRAVALGERLFFDPRLSSTGTVSCASCHDPSRGFGDPNFISVGVNFGERHAPSLWNVAHQRWFYWDGRADSLWSQAVHPIERDFEMDFDRVSLARLIAGDGFLRAVYEDVFGALPRTEGWPERARPMEETPGHPDHAAWLSMDGASREEATRVLVNVGKALGAFQRTLVTGRARFDEYVEGLREGDAGKLGALSAEEVRGLGLFVGEARCVECHAGPTFSDGSFHDTRLPTVGGKVAVDPGRYEGARLVKASAFNAAGVWSDDPAGARAEAVGVLVARPHDWGKFKTPGLRNVELSGPYMHGGQFETLAEVLAHYNTFEDSPPLNHHQVPETALVPLGLPARDLRALEAFLRSLTDERGRSAGKIFGGG